MSQGLSQRQIQTLRLSPQQILYTKLLQLPVVQLEQRVKQELEENPLIEESLEPVLEELETDDALPAEPAPEPAALEAAVQEQIESPIKIDKRESPAVETKSETEEKPAKEENDFDAELAEYIGQSDDEGYKVQSIRDNDDDERDYFQPAYEENLSEKLLAQLRLLDISEKELQIAEEIIGNLDDDGYLRCPLPIIQDGLLMLGVSATEKEIEAVLEKIWYLDPAGIGARNLQECLLIQLSALANGDLAAEHEEACDLAYKILSQHYDDFAKKHYDKLLQDLALAPDALKRTIAFIQKLNPKPGGNAPLRIGNYVIPDFTISFNGEELVLTANERANIQIRLSKHYRKLLDDKSQSKETKEFLRDKLASAKGFLGAIQMRRFTMQKVMTALMNRQYDFFVQGASKLKPMILKDIAEDTNLDIATISRVVNGKYVLTDYGVFELKYFFTTAMETESGDEISNRIIKQAIKDYIEKEESGKPLSDDKLAELLAERGYKLARRTVTKYREQLGIPVARLRKKIESIG